MVKAPLVKAPFRFARINRWIREPDWADLVSHDVPFADGISGSATIRITAKTPLLVGGIRRKATPNAQGEVWPFEVPGIGFALPPSSLQGLCRSILEIAAFGRLGSWIENRRFGIRDLTKTATAKFHYGNRLSEKVGAVITPKTKAGWLVMRDGKPVIVPCKLSRLHIDELSRLREALVQAKTGNHVEPEDQLRQGEPDAGNRYNLFLAGLDDRRFLEQNFIIEPATKQYHESISANIFESYCHAAGASPGTAGTIVITGKTNGHGYSMGLGRKKREFVFYGPSRAELEANLTGYPMLEIDASTWDAFLYLHCTSKGEPSHPGWQYWAGDFKNDRPVPVFWWEDQNDPERVSTLGMAFAFKAAFPQSTHDLLRHSHPDHLKAPADAPLDLPHLIFGVAAEGDNGQGLKRRAWFGLGRCTARPHTVPFENLILASPKPNYFPFYVRQRKATDHKIRVIDNRNNNHIIEHGEPMAAYATLDSCPPTFNNGVGAAQKRAVAEPELAGVKIWPSETWPEAPFTPRPPAALGAGMQPPGNNVKTKLNALPSGTVFEIPLTFHNLRPMELGALLWALSFGDIKAFGKADNTPRLRHRLGMGKPLGLGEVEIEIASGGLLDDDGTAIDPVVQLKAFTNHMNQHYPRTEAWAQSPQVLALLKAADPTLKIDQDLHYPSLNVGGDSYVKLKSDGRFMGAYVSENSELLRFDPEQVNPREAHGAPAAGRHQIRDQVPQQPAADPPAPVAERLEPVLGAVVKLNQGAFPEITIREGTIVGFTKKFGKPFILKFGDVTVKADFTQFSVLSLPTKP